MSESERESKLMPNSRLARARARALAEADAMRTEHARLDHLLSETVFPLLAEIPINDKHARVVGDGDEVISLTKWDAETLWLAASIPVEPDPSLTPEAQVSKRTWVMTIQGTIDDPSSWARDPDSTLGSSQEAADLVDAIKFLLDDPEAPSVEPGPSTLVGAVRATKVAVGLGAAHIGETVREPQYVKVGNIIDGTDSVSVMVREAIKRNPTLLQQTSPIPANAEALSMMPELAEMAKTHPAAQELLKRLAAFQALERARVVKAQLGKLQQAERALTAALSVVPRAPLGLGKVEIPAKSHAQLKVRVEVEAAWIGDVEIDVKTLGPDTGPQAETGFPFVGMVPCYRAPDNTFVADTTDLVRFQSLGELALKLHSARMGGRTRNPMIMIDQIAIGDRKLVEGKPFPVSMLYDASGRNMERFGRYMGDPLLIEPGTEITIDVSNLGPDLVVVTGAVRVVLDPPKLDSEAPEAVQVAGLAGTVVYANPETGDAVIDIDPR